MSSEDWDLFAVVRSCSSSASTATLNTTSCGGGHEDNGVNCKQHQDPLPPPPLFTHIHGDRDRDRDKESSSSCNELQDSCKPFLPVTTTTTTTTWSSPPPPPPKVSSAPNVLMKQEQGLLESQDQKPPLGVRVFSPPTTSSSSSVFLFRGQRDPLLQPQSQAPLRSRKRKNQQKRTICHVTQENLSSDMWAWRKYGQKPIKGSPYPRNYYRCSSSKGCLARKQVERSNLDPNIFIVTYTGEHTHPRPTHRNSLAGSTRNKSQHVVNPIPTPNPSGQTVLRSDTVKEENHLSPTTPLKENDNVQGTNGDEDIISQEVNMEDEEEEDEVEGEEDDEDDDVNDLLIPNYAVRDRDNFFFAGNFPSWSAGSAGDGGV
ncbi:putative WRKY transcription factor 27 [Cardamine amara subsp. amara]|uniref:WRKY transcription factor 27 n=1 Tax=Cardamine amara subsp. amara TaxID=228776 RepID=A0ABD1AJ12_CARAN